MPWPRDIFSRRGDAYWRDAEHLAYGLESHEFDDDYADLVFLAQELAVLGLLPTVPHTFTHNRRAIDC